MTFNSLTDAVAVSLQELLVEIGQFLPLLVIAILLLLVGWIVGAALGHLIERLVQATRVNEAFEHLGAGDVLSRAGLPLNAGKFLGSIVKWFFIIVFLVAALDVLNLSQVNLFLREIVLGYLPQVIVAVLIIFVAAVLAQFVERVVSAGAQASGLASPFLLGSIAKWAIWVFALLAALNELKIAEEFTQTLFTGIVLAVALALGISFGFGGQDAARRFVERVEQGLKNRKI